MTLRWKLTLLTAGLLVLALTSFAALAGALLWRVEVSSINRQLSAQSLALLAAAQRNASILDISTEDVLETDGISSVARVYQGNKLAWAGGASGPDVLDSAFLRSVYSQQLSERLSQQDGYLVSSRRAQGITVQVGRSLRPLYRLLERYAAVALLSLLLAAGLTALLVAWQVGQAMQPLERLVQRVQNLDTPAQVPGTQERGEVGELARALERSLSNLQAERAHESFFLASASHELRTPVTAMLTDLQHTLARERPPEELRAALERTERTAVRLRQLTGNLMTLMRTQRTAEHAGSAAPLVANLNAQPLDLLELAGEAVDLLLPLALSRQIDLWLDGAPTPTRLDPGLINGLLENLIGNAIKFTPEGGQIQVRVQPISAVQNLASHETIGQCSELLVEDSGPGFPAQTPQGDLTAAFVRGVQGQGQPEGFGLGLAVVRQVVAAHGGTLHLGRSALGGAQVRVILQSLEHFA